MYYIKELVSKEKLARTPIWLMRQAGRFLPEYRKIKEGSSSFLEMCYTPEIAAKITLLPIDQLDFDAAIIFSDILVIPHGLGFDLKFINGEGPALKTISATSNISKLKLDNRKLSPTYEAISMVKSRLKKGKELIGFAGAPWTLLSYMIEGSGSRDFAKSKVFITENPEITKELVDILIESVSEHLIKQIEAGADIVQIFDSWAGFLTEEDYYRLVVEPTEKIVKKVKSEYGNIPIIGFPRGSSFLYEKYAKETGVDVMSIDQFVPLEWAAKKLKSDVIIQGNLDPRCLLCSKKQIKKHVDLIQERLGRGEFIFNLGHGVLPSTPVDNVKYLVRLVRGEA